MPTPAPSPLKTGRRITDVIGTFFATSIDVCRAGDRVALHLATTSGEIVITLAAREFVLKCRGVRDHNLNPLPNPIDVLRAEARERQARSLEPAPLPTETAAPVKRRRKSPAAAAEFERAWTMLKASPALSVRQVAEICGVNASCLSTWATRRHPGELADLRRALNLPVYGRRPVLPANLTQAAAAGVPLVKPSGQVL